MLANQIRKFRDVSTVFYHSNAAVNILPFKEIARTADIMYDKRADLFRVLSRNSYTYIFFNSRSGLYMCYLRFIDAEETSLTIVHENERLYTEREIAWARKAKEVIRSFGYPSPRSAI